MKDSLIEKPVQEFNLSESFKDMCHRHDFRTLNDILNWPVNVLLLHEGFTYHHYQELRELLQQNELLNKLKVN